MAASESHDPVVMETGLEITTFSMINIPWKFKWPGLNLWKILNVELRLNAAELYILFIKSELAMLLAISSSIDIE